MKSSPDTFRYIKYRQPRDAIRYSRHGYVTEGGITNLPLYLGMTIKLV